MPTILVRKNAGYGLGTGYRLTITKKYQIPIIEIAMRRYESWMKPKMPFPSGVFGKDED